MDQTPSPSGPSEEESAAATVSPSAQASAPPPKERDEAAAERPRAAAPPQLGREIGGKKFRVGTGDEYVPFRSRTKRRRRMIAAGVVGALVLGAGVYGVVTLVGSDPQTTTVAACPAKANSNVNPAAMVRAGAAGSAQSGSGPVTVGQIKLNVYNSTNRHGLAAAAATELKKRGFTIGKVTNDPLKANLTVSAQVRGASASAMRIVAAEVTGAELHSDTRKDGTVDLVLGAAFTALASPDQVSATLASPSPTTAKTSAAACH